MGAGRTDHIATVEKKEGGLGDLLVRSEEFCDTL